MNEPTNRISRLTTEADAKLTILECPSCGGKHTDLDIREFAKPYGVYTHHFVCPTTEDPGFLSLHTHNGTASEVDANICRCALNAQQTGRWLAAFFSVDDGKIRLDMVNNHMPHSDWLPAANLLKEHMQRELGTDKEAPAPADTTQLQPLINLFSNEPIAAEAPDAPEATQTHGNGKAANETPEQAETPQATPQDAKQQDRQASEAASREMKTPQVLEQFPSSSQGNEIRPLTDKYPAVEQPASPSQASQSLDEQLESRLNPQKED